jgi:uncharacterized protein (TIGR02118 family)
MVRLTVCYGHPIDPESFDHHYRDVHRPLAEAMPGLKEIRLGWCQATAAGGAPPYHLVAELSFDDLEALELATRSPQGRIAAEDVQNFSDGGATLFIQLDSPPTDPTQIRREGRSIGR